MPAWDLASARLQLRSQLGDLPSDKFVFKAIPFPVPDGSTTVFHTGDTNLIEDSLTAYLDGNQVSVNPSGTPNWDTGEFELHAAPAKGSDLTVTYFYQWFTDAQIDSFLSNGAYVLGMETVIDDTISFGLRPALVLFSAYFAYMKKAAETADALKANAEGFNVDQSSASQNWKKLAENAWNEGKDMMEFFQKNLLNVGGIGIKITTYRMPPYVPNS